MAAILAQV